MDKVPQHPFLHHLNPTRMDKCSSKTYSEARSEETMMVNIDPTIEQGCNEPAYISNRQQAVLSLLQDEFSSYREMQNKAFGERLHREMVEQNLMQAQGRANSWELAYNQCLAELSIQTQELEKLRQEFSLLKQSTDAVSELPYLHYSYRHS
jgi:hypothetical protein